MLLYFSEMVLAVNIINRSLKTLQICQMLVDLSKVMLPFNIKYRTNKALQVGMTADRERRANGRS